MKSMIEIITGRHNFSIEYCKNKGWDFENLSIEQILEIRQQDGWKEPK